MLSEEATRRIEAAIAAAEKTTSGEIFCIYERRLPPDAATPALVAALASLALSPLAAAGIVLAVRPWTAAQAALTASPLVWLGEYALLQAAIFGAVWALFAIPAVRRALTPRAVKRARAHRAALEHFLVRGLHLTRDRTGVLIFVVEEDHQIEIVADQGIHSKVRPEAWAEATAALAAGLKRGDAGGGFEAAIGQCAALLTQHFPRRADDTDELPNRVLVID